MTYFRSSVSLPPWFAFALLLATVLSGCSSPNSSPDARRPRIALIMKSLANDFFTTMAEGAKTHQADNAGAYELIVNGIKDETDVGRQIAIVEEMMALDVDAIVIAPADSKALAPVCKRAQDAGIVVINIDNKMDPSVLSELEARIPFVGPDNRAGARAVGDFLASRLRGKGPVAILEGIVTADNGVQRKLGFQDAMEAAGIEIVSSQSAQWEMDQANRITSAILNEHTQLKAILCANDSMALGALAACRAANRVDVLIVGFDNISAVRSSVARGEILATADQHGDQLAVYGIEFALDVLAGESPADKQTPVDLITQDEAGN